MGVKENLDPAINPGGVLLFSLLLVILVFSIIAFSVRAYVKIVMIKKLTDDDWLMFAGVIMYIPYIVLCIIGPAVGGTGRFTSELTPDGIEVALRSWAICEVLYPPMSLFIRMSIARFLLRLAVVPWHRWIAYAVIVLNIIVSIGYWVPMLIQCIPLSYFWTAHKGAQGYCIDHTIVPMATVVHSILGAILDWILALLPIAMLWKVQINLRTKVTLSLLLSLGIVSGVILMLRIPFLKIIEVSADFLHATVAIATVSVLEPGLGIIAGCAVTFRPLFKRFKLGSTSGTKSKRTLGPDGAASSSRSGRDIIGVWIISSGRKGKDKSNTSNTGHLTYKNDLTDRPPSNGSEMELRRIQPQDEENWKGSPSPSERDWDLEAGHGAVMESSSRTKQNPSRSEVEIVSLHLDEPSHARSRSDADR